MAVKENTLKEPVKEGIERSVNDNYCRLCCCPLKIKFGECIMQNLFKVSKGEGFQNGTLSEI